MILCVCREERDRERERGERERGDRRGRERDRDRYKDRDRDREGGRERDRGHESGRGSRSARARAWEEETPQNTPLRASGETPCSRRDGKTTSLFLPRSFFDPEIFFTFRYSHPVPYFLGFGRSFDRTGQ